MVDGMGDDFKGISENGNHIRKVKIQITKYVEEDVLVSRTRPGVVLSHKLVSLKSLPLVVLHIQEILI